MRLLRYKKQILLAAAVLGLLAFVYWWGGNAPSLHGWRIAEDAPQAAETSIPEEFLKKKEPKAADDSASARGAAEEQHSDAETPEQTVQKEETQMPAEEGDAAYSVQNGMELSEDTGRDRYETDPVPAGKPVPKEPQEVEKDAPEYTCTFSVRCDALLENLSALDPEKVELVPKDGVILSERAVSFYEGENVFQVLRRELRREKIPMESVNTPVYHSAYVEGIANLYEFDCGELSGWVYRVNGWFPNYGCSRYLLKPGDRVEWVYTCDRGADVGGSLSEGGQKDA